MAQRCQELNGRRILVVEDEILVAMEVEDLLEEHGCILLATASTVHDALQRISQCKPDLVLLDRNLNGDRSTPIAEELNRIGVPFVVLTGYVHGISDEPALRNAACVQKPWKPDELLNRLREALS
jgi:CheY-like chemotaxis protein